MKKKPSFNIRKCKIRINIKKFENIQLTRQIWGFEHFHHNLN